MRHEYFWLSVLMIEKGASKDELEELEECWKKISDLKFKYGFVSHPLKEVRSLKETGHTAAEIAEELNLDKVEVRPMMKSENRDYIITYYELGSDKVEQRRFHTLKHLSDWINSDDTAVAITGIDEVPGLKINDKYYKEVAEEKIRLLREKRSERREEMET